MKRVFSGLWIVVLLCGVVAAQGARGGLKLPPAKRVTLANGLTVILTEQHEIPLVSLSLLVRGGSVADPAGREGVASITAALLRKGTTKRSAERLAEEFDFIGATFNAGATIDYTAITPSF